MTHLVKSEWEKRTEKKSIKIKIKKMILSANIADLVQEADRGQEKARETERNIQGGIVEIDINVGVEGQGQEPQNRIKEVDQNQKKCPKIKLIVLKVRKVTNYKLFFQIVIFSRIKLINL